MIVLARHISGFIKKPEWVFLITFLFFGLLSILITPPYQGADERLHFVRAYEFSQGTLFTPRGDDGKVAANIPSDFVKLEELAQFSWDNTMNLDYKYNNLDYKKMLALHGNGQNLSYLSPSTAVYPPVSYLPGILAHWITQIFNLPLLVSMYIGRILFLLTAGVAIFFAIRVLPFGKWFLACLGIFPGFVVASSTFGSDAVTLGASILFISLILAIAYGRMSLNNYKKWGLLGVLAVAVCLAKPTTFLLVFFIAAIPLLNAKYRNKESVYKIALIILISIGITFLWLQATSYVETISGNPNINPSLQKQHLIQNPASFANAMLHTFSSTHPMYGDRTLRGFFGLFSWQTIALPLSAIFLLFTALLASLGLKDSREITSLKNSLRVTWVMWLTAILLIAAICGALYVYNTDVGLNVIKGVQGRYFYIPALLIGLCLTSGILIRNQRLGKAYMIIVMLICLLLSIGLIYKRFYIA